MQLEIFIDQNSPQVYPIRGEKMILGSAPGCDVVIDAFGISRKHACLIVEGDKFSVVDLGSTNGSYINEKRLVPGVKTEFTTFFPLRLSNNVLVGLLSEEDLEGQRPSFEGGKVSVSSSQDKTQVVSLKDLHRGKTEKLIHARHQKKEESYRRTGNKSSPKAKKKKRNFVPFLMISFLVSAGILNYLSKENRAEKEVEEYAEIGEIITSPDLSGADTKGPGPAEKNYLIPETELPQDEYFEKIKNEMKCSTDKEKIFCSYLPGVTDGGHGVTQSGLSFYARVNGTSFLKQARDLLGSSSGGENPGSLIYDTAVYFYLLETLKKDLDITLFKDSKLFILFYEKNGEGEKPFRKLALKPEYMKELRSYVVESNLPFIKTHGDSALNITRNHYRTY